MKIALKRDPFVESIISEELGDCVEYFDLNSRLEDLVNVGCLWVDMTTRVDEEILGFFPNLRFVITPTTGVTHLDVAALERAGISIISLQREFAFLEGITATSEMAWALALAVWRRILPASQKYVSDVSIRQSFGSLQINGLCVGLIGFGRLGKRIHSYAKCFGMKSVVYDPYIETNELMSYPEVEHCSTLDELCSKSDMVFLLASHKESLASSYPILKKSHLDIMKKSSIVINVARGSLLDEEALAYKIRNGEISGVGVDVLAREDATSINDALSSLQVLQREGFNVIVTPHLGGMCWDAFEEAHRFVARKLKGIS